MSASSTRSLPVGVWTLLVAALILSVAAIMLHVTHVLDRLGAYSNRYDAFELQQLQVQFNTLRAELSKLQADIAAANSFKQLKRSAQQNDSSEPAASLTEGLEIGTPEDAVALLDRSQRLNRFDDYQHVHPEADQRLIEDIFLANRELKQAYATLYTAIEGRWSMDEQFSALHEAENARLTRLLFSMEKRYELLDVVKQNDRQARIRVKVVTTIGEQESSKVVELRAVREGQAWKVADDADAQAAQKKILSTLKEQIKQVRGITRQIQDGQHNSQEALDKALKTLPLKVITKE